MRNFSLLLASFLTSSLSHSLYAADACKSQPLEHHVMNGKADGELFRHYENTEPKLISMTVKAAVSLCKRKDGTIYFVFEEYMNRKGTRLVYFPVSAIQSTVVAASYFGDQRQLGENDYLINLGRTDAPINKRDLFLLKERGEELTVVYMLDGGWSGFEHKMKLKR